MIDKLIKAKMNYFEGHPANKYLKCVNFNQKALKTLRYAIKNHV